MSNQLIQRIFLLWTVDTGGTRNVTGETRSSEACLSREQVLRLGKVALVLEQAYAAPRDTEWAFFKVTTSQRVYRTFQTIR